MQSDADPPGSPRAKRQRPTKAKRATAPKPARKGAYHHGDLRRALLEATLQLVEERGPQGFTLRAAAKAAGVTAGASYHHFEDKDALLAAVAEEGFDLFRQALQEAAEQPAKTARERSRNVGTAYVLFAVKHPTRFRIMVGYGVQSRFERRKLATSAVATYKLVRETLVCGLTEDGAPRVREAEVLGWWSVVHGLSFLAIDGHLGKAGTHPQSAGTLVQHVLAALSKA